MELYVRSETVVCRMIAGETLIVPISKGVGDLASIYSLNPVATTIWDAISNPRSKREIVQVIAREFEGESAEIERDLEIFLGEMESVGLVTVVRMAASS
jgi:hypothetical protein